MCTQIQEIMLSHIFLSSTPKFIKEFWVIRDKSNLKFYVKAEMHCLVLALDILG